MLRPAHIPNAAKCDMETPMHHRPMQPCTQYHPYMATTVRAVNPMKQILWGTPTHPTSALEGLGWVRELTPHDVSLDAPVHCKNFMSCSYAQCSEILMTPQQHSISTHLNLHHGMLRPHKPNAAECNMGHPQPCSHAPSTIPTWQHRGMVPHAHIHHAI